MEITKSLDFDCPQFVDFGASESSGKEDDLFFDCKSAVTPDQNKQAPKNVPGVFIEEVHTLTEEAENRLLDKVDSAIMEITPNVKRPVKSRLLSEKFPKEKESQVVKATVKPFTAPSMHERLLRSKSIAQLNKIITESKNQNKELGLRKRSSSLGDLRTHKKQKYPHTPMCLKRTMVKSKTKVIKTTEERELEEIARLRQKLARHLRLNEMNLKKMNLNSRPCVVPKAPPKAENKGLNNLMKDLNIAENKDTRSDIQRIRKTTMKIDSIINRQPVPAGKNVNPVVNFKNPSVFSASEMTEEKKRVPAKEPVSNKKVLVHSGLMFHPSFKKSASLNPFVVNPKLRVTKSESADVSGNVSALSLKIDDKENISQAKKQSNYKKNDKMQNTKVENKIFNESNKKVIGKQPVNPSRGLPLSENIKRH